MGRRPSGEVNDGEGTSLALDQIGSVYANVQLVADNIADIINVSDNMDELGDIAAALGVITTAVTDAQAAAASAAASATSADVDRSGAETAVTAAELAEVHAELAETNSEAALAAALAAQLAAEAAAASAEEIAGGDFVTNTEFATAQLTIVHYADDAYGWGAGNILLDYNSIVVGDGTNGFALLFQGSTAANSGLLYLASGDETNWWQIDKKVADATFVVRSSHATRFDDPVLVPDDAYGPGWDGNLETATKNAIYDKIEALAATSAGGLSYQGTWNATTNSPAIAAAASGNTGYYYKVATAGTTAIDGIAEWAIGDWIISNGTSWDKIDNSEVVSSVAGLVGAISAANLKTALSLDNVDNTSDANKPVSTAQQTALDLKLNAAGAVTSVAGRTGAVTLTAVDLSTAAAGYKLIGKATTGAGACSEIAVGSDQLVGRAGAGNIGGIDLHASLIVSGGALQVVSVANTLTFNNGGAGSGTGITYNGALARTISYNTVGAAPALTPQFAKNVSFTAADTDNNGHGVYSGAAKTLTLNSTPSPGCSFTGRFTTAWSVACANGCSKNGASPTGVTTATIAANTLATFLHEGSGIWVISGSGVS